MNKPQTANCKPLTILITGANGQLGREIAKQLKKDFDLILTDIENLDITDKTKLKKFIKSERPDFIIHGAAYTKVDDAQENKKLCQKINALGTKNIARAAQEIGATIIYISSDYVFDGKKNQPYRETDKTNPLSVYGQTKLDGEKYIQEICKKYYIIRTSWVFGEGKNFIETMLALSKTKKELNIVSDQIGSPTYTKDLTKVINKIIFSKIPFGIYNFSGEGECSWFDFAQEIFRLNKIKIKVVSVTSAQYPQKAQRPAYSYLDKSKIKNTLHIKIRPWQKMLKEYLADRIK